MPLAGATLSVLVVIRCADPLVPRVRYVFDTLFMAGGVQVHYSDAPPLVGPWVLYADAKDSSLPLERCVAIVHGPDAWRLFDGDSDAESPGSVNGIMAAFPKADSAFNQATDIPFDLVANAFYFLSSWSERGRAKGADSRELYATSIFARHGYPQDIVDQYLERLINALRGLGVAVTDQGDREPRWPNGAAFAVALSHDVDFLPSGLFDNLHQGAKTLLRHLVRQGNPADAWRAGKGLVQALLAGRDPYGCIPAIIAEEKRRGVRSSFQVAVAHRHPADVNYDVGVDRTRDYLRAITDEGFDLCLHGSYRSTEQPSWYVDEAALLGSRLARPLGSRQHYLSFDYDVLFAAQEKAGIQYDMSMGFPDRVGPRAGFSYPYFPFCLAENRPYDVVEISLFFMDVTLRSYMDLGPRQAREALESGLADLQRKRGAVSIVWHPIVFGGARDPGYDRVYWEFVERIQALGGMATDGRTINDHWRERARNYASFSSYRSRLAAATT